MLFNRSYSSHLNINHSISDYNWEWSKLVYDWMVSFSSSYLLSSSSQPQNLHSLKWMSFRCSSFSSFLLFLLIIFPLISTQSQPYHEEVISQEVECTPVIDEQPPLEGNIEKGRAYRKTFTNEWAVLIENGNEDEADRIASRYGYVNMGRIMDGENYFLFRSLSIRKRSSRKTRSLQSKELSHDGEVLWLEQQISKKRVKRVAIGEGGGILNGNKGGGIRMDIDSSPPNDPLWTDMWYLHGANGKKNYHNIQEAWDLGYTGKDIVVTILDDGLEWNHPDIAPNYDRKASLDVNDRDEDPMPRYEYSDENRHGTRCAGEVAAVFNNSQCIVGIAYEAKIGGIRMLDGDVTDAVEAASLSHNNHHIDIYSASWGPDDDGRTVDGPAKLTKAAFEKGIREGRNGKGNIYIWASGNGGKDADSCNCDGYTNSIYTLSISSATESGNIPWYSEACSSTLATTFSSGATGEKMIVTTDLHHACTTAHTGTSASAPLAAGIVALTLQANPNLTWRDMQHIVVRTARPLFLRAGDWQINGVGRNVSHSFGYGLMDAHAMVKIAETWVTVPEQHRCAQYYPSRFKSIPHGNRLQLQLYTDGCESSPEHSVTYVEHVQAILTLKAPKRGDVQIYLTSPSGTRSTLLTKRARDTSRTGFVEWAFMSTHSWGELASGLWILDIDNDGWDDAELIKWDLVIYGTVSEVGSRGGIHSVPLAARSLSKYAVSTSYSHYSPIAFFHIPFILLLLLVPHIH
ncbi:kpc-1 [Pristionchus pacificus]|nr:kpc-1 [Pristionchus pacificus]|eukprot:PDM75951.1 kpc-1 [Pristionchus pacificus]